MGKKKKELEHVVKQIYPGSIAEELEIRPGDVLLEINGQKIEDVFDYRYLIKDEYIEVLVRKPDGEEWLLEIDKEYDEDLGLEFENGLMSEYRSCSNRCIFCFIDQMPPGMRDTLYFKDDDSRLSFLQGNYITLTNMKQEDIDRIIRMHLAPINISVQTTNPKLRCKMLNNRFAGEKLKYLDTLYEHQIEMNGQVVCCKGVNDGKELERTIHDLEKYLPFLRSVSVVPAGLTRFRQGLYPLELFSAGEAGEVIDLIESLQPIYYEKYGLHFIHASDEWYFLAGRDFPEEERYDGYIQLENGVGMIRLLMNEFADALQEEKEHKDYAGRRETVCRKVTIATGKLAYPVICTLAEKMTEAFPKLKIRVCEIRNDFFGETITVSGLITGRDLVDQLKEQQAAGLDLGEELLIPENMLRMGEQVFLDDMTVQEAERMLGLRVTAVDASGQSFVEALLEPGYCMERENDNFVYIQAYDRQPD
ncbi:MAG: DUF512 domain-containing protein [Lachnospiraceae bacterium]|nr:DUF512 domain-containing protein [Lachnospiraceae bacterium]